MFERHQVALDQLNTVAHELLTGFAGQKVFAFYGEMGAGKTTFIQALCKALGCPDTVTSPTFAIINEYTARDGEPVYHFDFYRIKNLGEAFDLGYEDYFFGGNYCLIEWPEKIEPLLPQNYVSVQIVAGSEHLRDICAKPVG